jgi:enamine deaminase RidA (YjgF/YER057c/UK114 family)
MPINEEIAKFYAESGAVVAPNTWLGVTSLALPEFLIEIEATAALD